MNKIKNKVLNKKSGGVDMAELPAHPIVQTGMGKDFYENSLFPEKII
ncbi:MAG: hypothetical protein ACLT2Z_01590 [Eubacterium sp.]